MNETRWASLPGARSGADYAKRFAELAASGADVHGEAAFCARLVEADARILDAGCGTGRVATRLAELGFDCVGVDADPSMVAQARSAAPDLRWIDADLAEMDGDDELTGPFDLVVAAGNVMPLLSPGSEARVLAALAERLAPGGRLVAGFGLDAAHLPLDEAPFGLAEYDRWCAVAGLDLEGRYATWSGEEFDGGGYAVSVHRRRT